MSGMVDLGRVTLDSEGRKIFGERRDAFQSCNGLELLVLLIEGDDALTATEGTTSCAPLLSRPGQRSGPVRDRESAAIAPEGDGGEHDARGASARQARAPAQPTSRIAEDLDDVYNFGPFRLSPRRPMLCKGTTPLRLGSRAMALLLELVRRSGELIPNHELIRAAWPATHVEEVNLRVHISALRHTLSDDPRSPAYISNVTGRGYRFVAEVSKTSASGCLTEVADYDRAHGKSAGPPGPRCLFLTSGRCLSPEVQERIRRAAAQLPAGCVVLVSYAASLTEALDLFAGEAATEVRMSRQRVPGQGSGSSP